MAGTSLLALLDDIATLLDDVSVMGKVAAKKTAAVLGDDLSLNAQQVTGVKANRELPVVWRVAKGSLINKVILVPLALVISAFVPWLITPLLMIGGAYLCLEGIEKILDWIFPEKDKKSLEARQARLEKLNPQQTQDDEKDKIKGAIRTDFILSAEIVILTLGIVSNAPLLDQVIVMAGIAILVTVAVYGLVSLIVKIDDLGYWLKQRNSSTAQHVGNGLLFCAPWLMKVLSVLGTLAMFLVGGGIIIHGLPKVHQFLTQYLADLPELISRGLMNIGAPLVIGMLIGLIVLSLVKLTGRFFRQ